MELFIQVQNYSFLLINDQIYFGWMTNFVNEKYLLESFITSLPVLGYLISFFCFCIQHQSVMAPSYCQMLSSFAWEKKLLLFSTIAWWAFTLIASPFCCCCCLWSQGKNQTRLVLGNPGGWSCVVSNKQETLKKYLRHMISVTLHH